MTILCCFLKTRIGIFLCFRMICIETKNDFSRDCIREKHFSDINIVLGALNVGLQVVDLEKVVHPAHQTKIVHMGPTGPNMTPSSKFKDDVVVSTWAMLEAPRGLVVGGRDNHGLYVLTPANLMVFDISEAPNLTMVGATTITNGLHLAAATDVVYTDAGGKMYRGDLAFVSRSGQSNELEIYDVTQFPLSKGGQGVVEDRVVPPMQLLATWKVGGTMGEMLPFKEKGILVANVFKGTPGVSGGTEETVIFDIKQIGNTPKVLGMVSNAYRHSLVTNEAKTHFFLASGSPGASVAVDQWSAVTWKEATSPLPSVGEGQGEGEKMLGVVTDGAARVKADIQIRGMVTGSKLNRKVTVALSPRPNGGEGQGEGGLCTDDKAEFCKETSLSVDLVWSKDRYVISTSTPVYYQGPDTFVRFGDTKHEKDDKTAKSREVKVVVTESGKELAKGSIILQRPAVLLLHGVWGSGDDESDDYTWKTFAPLLKQQGHYTVVPVDYSKLNANAFDDPEIRKKLTKTIKKVLDDLRAQKIAGERVDIVAHSMGGLVVRSFCKDNPDACKKTIRKLITIDTPHQGSELADWLLLYERNRDTAGGFYDQLQMRSLSPNKKDCNERIDAFVKGKSVKLYNVPLKVQIPSHPVVPKGAVDSLATGTVAPLTIPPGRWNDMVLNGVRTHALIGRMPDLVPDMLSAIATGVSKDMWWLWQQALDSCGLTQGDVFGGLANGSDGVVSGRSQQGRFDRPYSSNVGEAIDHLTVTGSEKAVEQVRELLEGKMELFAPLGAP